MADKEPILCDVVLGVLRPRNQAAKELLASLPHGSTVRIEVKRARGNLKRLAWYWVMLRLALDNLADAFDGPMTPRLLHLWLKRRAGLSKPIRSTKTGEIIAWDDESIAFDSMPENDRAQFVDFASGTLSQRLGVDVTTLRQEAEQAA